MAMNPTRMGSTDRRCSPGAVFRRHSARGCPGPVDGLSQGAAKLTETDAPAVVADGLSRKKPVGQRYARGDGLTGGRRAVREALRMEGLREDT